MTNPDTIAVIVGEKTCYVCRETKPSSQFALARRDLMCKPCRKEYDKARRHRASPVNDSPAARARKRRWNMENKNPYKQAARRAVRSAIERGDLVPRDECEACGESPMRSDGVRAVQAHHDDYSRPLSVRWLCPRCHRAWHKVNDAAMPQEPDEDE